VPVPVVFSRFSVRREAHWLWSSRDFFQRTTPIRLIAERLLRILVRRHAVVKSELTNCTAISILCDGSQIFQGVKVYSEICAHDEGLDGMNKRKWHLFHLRPVAKT
jgi:hypothetical protein